MKSLTITAAMQAALKKIDENLDLSTISVFEATAVNTLPVVKRGSIFHGATLTEATLQEMADYQNGGGNVPMHLIHDQGYALPVGKVFYTEKKIVNGLAEARILFYLPNTETDLISKLNSSTIDEVSIGFEAKHMLCSECGFDYKGSEATMENFWNQSCNEGHTISEDGVHLNLSGLENWYETSLVSRGAARGAKIVGRAKSLLGETEYNRLAASGIAPDAKILFATATPNPKAPEKTMDVEKLVAQFATATGEIAVLKASEARHASTVTELTARATTAEGRATTAEGRVTELTAEVERLKATPDAAAAQKAASDLAAGRTAMFTLATRFAVASGTEKPVETADMPALLASIEASQAKLATLPLGGAAIQQQEGAPKTASNFAASSFKTRN